MKLQKIIANLSKAGLGMGGRFGSSPDFIRLGSGSEESPRNEKRSNTMSNFTQPEIEFLNSQRLGRLATVNPAGEPHVVPVGFRYNAETDTIDIGGHNIAATKKFRDVGRTGRAAFVVDIVLPPWQAKGIEVRGNAENFPTGGEVIGPQFAPEMIRIYPERIIGWGIEGDAYHQNSRSVGQK